VRSAPCSTNSRGARPASVYALLPCRARPVLTLCQIHLFAHLTAAGVVSVGSMTALLQAFVAVLDELGVSHRRAKHAALCAAEGLMRAGAVLVKDGATAGAPAEMLAAIQAYIDTTAAAKALVQPYVRLEEDAPAIEGADEVGTPPLRG
jgi:nuclear cap-binding protein subunit 1